MLHIVSSRKFSRSRTIFAGFLRLRHYVLLAQYYGGKEIKRIIPSIVSLSPQFEAYGTSEKENFSIFERIPEQFMPSSDVCAATNFYQEEIVSIDFQLCFSSST